MGIGIKKEYNLVNVTASEIYSSLPEKYKEKELQKNFLKSIEKASNGLMIPTYDKRIPTLNGYTDGLIECINPNNPDEVAYIHLEVKRTSHTDTRSSAAMIQDLGGGYGLSKVYKPLKCYLLLMKDELSITFAEDERMKKLMSKLSPLFELSSYTPCNLHKDENIYRVFNERIFRYNFKKLSSDTSITDILEYIINNIFKNGN